MTYTFTDAKRVSNKGPTKTSEYNTIAENTDATKERFAVEHDYSTGTHTTITLSGNIETDGTWDTGYIKLGAIYIWVNGDDIYVKTSAPSSATDGEIILRGTI